MEFNIAPSSVKADAISFTEYIFNKLLNQLWDEIQLSKDFTH